MHETDDTRSAATPRPRRERAQATVEFALVLPVLVMILFAVFEFGTAFWRFQQVSSAASEGARAAAVARTADDPAGVASQAARDAIPALDDGDLQIATTSTWSVGDEVTVTVSYPEQISILGISIYDSRLTAERSMRIRQ